MSNCFKFKLKDRVRNQRGDVGTVLGRAVSEEVNRVGARLIYTVKWDGDLAMQVPEEYLMAFSLYDAGNVVFTIRRMLKAQHERVGERDMLRATMEAREKQPPKNAEVERLEAEVTRLATELNRVRGEKE